METFNPLIMGYSKYTNSYQLPLFLYYIRNLWYIHSVVKVWQF